MGLGTKLETETVRDKKTVPPALEPASELITLIDGVNIPRKRRSCGATSTEFLESASMAEKNEETEPPILGIETPLMSVFDAATILMEMASSNVKNSPFDGSEKESRKRKRVPGNAKPLAGKIKKKKQKEQQKKKKQEKETVLVPTPDMPAAMRNRITEMGGYQIELVIQKELENTDMNKNHGRLSLPPKKLKIDFLTEEEEKLLGEHHEGKKLKGMNVSIIDPLLRDKVICLKKWRIGSGHVYCLMTQWNSFVRENFLKTGDHIQLWCFRIDRVDAMTGTVSSDLSFAMVKLEIISID